MIMPSDCTVGQKYRYVAWNIEVADMPIQQRMELYRKWKTRLQGYFAGCDVRVRYSGLIVSALFHPMQDGDPMEMTMRMEEITREARAVGDLMYSPEKYKCDVIIVQDDDVVCKLEKVGR